MQSVASIVASVLAALALAAGLVMLERYGPAGGATLGAAVAVAAIAAFLLAYDLLKREERASGAGPERELPGGGRKGAVRPLFETEDVIYIDAVPRNGTEHMTEALRDRRRDVNYVLRIALKPKNRYDPQALNEQLAILAKQVEPLPYVYFESADHRFVCFGDAETVYKLLKDPKGTGLVDLVNNGLADDLRDSFGELSSLTLSHKLTNADALGKMALRNQPLAMIVNEKIGRAVGPISWAVLATRVLRTKA